MPTQRTLLELARLTGRSPNDLVLTVQSQQFVQVTKRCEVVIALAAMGLVVADTSELA